MHVYMGSTRVLSLFRTGISAIEALARIFMLSAVQNHSVMCVHIKLRVDTRKRWAA